MSFKGSDNFDYKDLLAPPLRRNPLWRDLADVCNEVLGREVEERRRRLQKSREPVRNRRGDIISQIEYRPEADKLAVDIETGNILELATGETIPKARITRVISNTAVGAETNAIDYFEVEFVTKDRKRARWLMPIDAPQERNLLIKNSYMLGFDYFNTKLTTEDYQRLYEYLGMFWDENGLNDNFMKFIGFIKNMRLDMIPLWAYDDNTDIITNLQEFNETDMIKASQGGLWYLTSHVEIQYDLKDQNSIYHLDPSNIEELFYLFAPIMLVLERIVGTITTNHQIFIGSVVQAEVINYGINNNDVHITTTVPIVEQAEVINYGVLPSDRTSVISIMLGLSTSISVVNYGVIETS